MTEKESPARNLLKAYGFHLFTLETEQNAKECRTHFIQPKFIETLGKQIVKDSCTKTYSRWLKLLHVKAMIDNVDVKMLEQLYNPILERIELDKNNIRVNTNVNTMPVVLRDFLQNSAVEHKMSYTKLLNLLQVKELMNCGKLSMEIVEKNLS